MKDDSRSGKDSRGMSRSSDTYRNSATKRDSTTSRKSSNNSDLSSQFESFSRSLDRHTRALNNFISEFNKSTKSFNNNLNRFSSKLSSNGPVEASRHGTGPTGSTSSTIKEGTDEVESLLEDIRGDMERDSDIQHEDVSKSQKIFASIKSVITNIGKLVLSELKGGFDRIRDSYLSNIGDITSRMDLTRKEYEHLYDDAAAYFKKEELNGNFSPVDYAEALKSVLDTGLRGDDAKEQAYRNLITNKLMPAISTNTAAYRKMSKKFGETFDKNTLAFAKYTEQVLGAEGIEEGKYSAAMDTLYADIMYSVGSDKDKAAEAMNNVAGAMSMLESKYNLDSSAFVETLAAAGKGQIGDNQVANALMGIFTESDLKEALTSPQKMAEVMEQYTNILSAHADNPDYMQSYANVLGLDESQVKIASGYVRGGGSFNNLGEDFLNYIEGFDPEKEIEHYWGRLKDNEYTSADAALTKKEENTMTYLATASTNIARFNEVLETATNIFKDLINIWAGGKLLNMLGGSSGGGGLLNMLGGSGGSSGGGLLSNIGSSFAGKGEVGGLGALAGIAGLIWTGVDVYKGIDHSDGNILEGLRTGLTGRVGMNEEESNAAANDALHGKRREFDLGSALSNAGKGALLGAGAASVIPGLGTAVGTIAGGLIGGISNAIDQYIENKKYNELADAVNAVTESMEALDASSQKFNKSVKNEKTVLDQLSIVGDDVNYSEKERLDMLEILKGEYPAELANIQDLNEWDSDYVDIIKDKIKSEKDASAVELLETAGSTIDKINSQTEAYENLYGEKSIGAKGYEFLQEIHNSAAEKGIDSEDTGDVTDLIGKYASEAGMSVEDFVSQINNATNGDIVYKSTINGEDKYFTTGFGNNYTADDNIEQALEAYNESGFLKDSNYQETQKQMREQVSTLYNQMITLWSNIKSIVEEYTNDEGVFDGPENIKLNAQDDLNALISSIPEYNREVAQAYSDVPDSVSKMQWHRDSSVLSGLDEVGSSLGIDIPNFKVGLNRVPSDEYLAELHKDEMVLNSRDASILRGISARGSGLNGILSDIGSMVGLSGKRSIFASNAGDNIGGLLDNFDKFVNAKTVSEDSSDKLSMSSVVDAINLHSKSTLSVLNSILDKLNVIVKKPNGVNKANIPESVLLLEGIR